MMKIDARTRYTIKVIKETFISLLKENPVNRVTVKKLCDEAGINRATFYRYYEDIYDLYEKVKEEFIDGYFANFPICDTDTLEQDIRLFLNEMKIHSDMVYAFAKQDDAVKFMQIVCEKIYSRFEDGFMELCPGLSRRQRQITYCFLVCACSGVLAEWINNEFRDETDEIAMMMTKLIKNALTNL